MQTLIINVIAFYSQPVGKAGAYNIICLQEMYDFETSYEVFYSWKL